MFQRGYITDYVKVVDASTADWHGSTAAESTPQVVKFDTFGYSGALVLVNTGTAVDDTEVSLTLTQSDTEAGTFTTVSGSAIEPSISGVDFAGNLAIYDVSNLSRRWLAVNAIKTGTTPSIQLAVTVILYNGTTSPEASVDSEPAGVFVKRILNA